MIMVRLAWQDGVTGAVQGTEWEQDTPDSRGRIQAWANRLNKEPSLLIHYLDVQQG